MVLAVSDSDVLIHFAKLNQLKLFKNQFSTIYLSEIVYNETVSDGIRLQKEDAFVIKKYIESEHIIKIKKVSQKEINDMIKKHHIHKGEASIIALAKELKIAYCLTNEIKVRKIIKAEGLKAIGTLGILLRAYKMNTIDKNELLTLLDVIHKNAIEYRIHPKLIEKVKEKIKNLA